ncbi:MAG: GNAT family N-acetyltransferase [Ktedonobacterales bacterium]|nr:GNAT family N-acetyltransferase [Ktedonobacterales bacterium]
MLQGEKVLLRAFKREDLVRKAEFANDPDYMVLVSDDPWRPESFEEIEARYEERLGEVGNGSVGFAIEADGVYIGHCTLFRFDELARTAMLGIGIGDRTYWGHGYGRDAIGLLLEYAFNLRNLRRVWLTVNATNERAYHAYRACGFVEEGRLRHHVWLRGTYDDLVTMGILREEWEART